MEKYGSKRATTPQTAGKTTMIAPRQLARFLLKVSKEQPMRMMTRRRSTNIMTRRPRKSKRRLKLKKVKL